MWAGRAMELTALSEAETVSGILDKEDYLARGTFLYEHNRRETGLGH